MKHRLWEVMDSLRETSTTEEGVSIEGGISHQAWMLGEGVCEDFIKLYFEPASSQSKEGEGCVLKRSSQLTRSPCTFLGSSLKELNC